MPGPHLSIFSPRSMNLTATSSPVKRSFMSLATPKLPLPMSLIISNFVLFISILGAWVGFAALAGLWTGAGASFHSRGVHHRASLLPPGSSSPCAPAGMTSIKCADKPLCSELPISSAGLKLAWLFGM